MVAISGCGDQWPSGSQAELVDRTEVVQDWAITSGVDLSERRPLKDDEERDLYGKGFVQPPPGWDLRVMWGIHECQKEPAVELNGPGGKLANIAIDIQNVPDEKCSVTDGEYEVIEYALDLKTSPRQSPHEIDVRINYPSLPDPLPPLEPDPKLIDSSGAVQDSIFHLSCVPATPECDSPDFAPTEEELLRVEAANVGLIEPPSGWDLRVVWTAYTCQLAPMVEVIVTDSQVTSIVINPGPVLGEYCSSMVVWHGIDLKTSSPPAPNLEVTLQD